MKTPEFLFVQTGFVLRAAALCGVVLCCWVASVLAVPQGNAGRLRGTNGRVCLCFELSDLMIKRQLPGFLPSCGREQQEEVMLG